MTSRGKFWGARQNFGGAVAPPGTPLAPPLASMISIVACCHGAKLCAHAARDFRSQQLFCSCFLLMTFLKRGTMLLITILMSACAFKRFLYLIFDKGVLNSDWHRYVVANGMSKASAVSQSLGSIRSAAIVQ